MARGAACREAERGRLFCSGGGTAAGLALTAAGNGGQRALHVQCAAGSASHLSPPTHLPLPLQQTFIDAVVKRLMSDAPLAILLSGGLDSSLVASVAVR